MYTASSCFPSGKLLGSAYTASTLAAFNYHDEHIYFSPGICPSGWAQQPVSSATVAGRAETTALCCEPGFTVTTSQLTGNDHVWRCYTNVTDALSTAAATKLISARQNFGAEPACALPCLTSAISVAGCAISDAACQCGTGQAAIQTAITPCLLSACNPVDIGVAASVGLALCSSYSAALTAPTAATATTTTTIKSASTSRSTSTSSISQASGTNTQTSVPSVVTSVVVTPFLISADPVFIKYRDGDFSSSTSSTGPSITSSPQPIGGLSMGAKIGLGVAIPLVLILIGVGSCIFYRKRKQRAFTANNAQATHEDMPPDYPTAFKAELQDPATNFSSRDILGPVLVKSELQAPTHNKTSVNTTEVMYVPELESARHIQEHAPTGSELDTDEQSHSTNNFVHQRPSELDISPISSGVGYGTSIPGIRQKQVNTGPLTMPEEFVVLPATGKGEDDEEELEYQERRLRERREILAEKEKIAREEEELRKLRRERKGGGGTSSGALS